jgi:hypothetical protein
MQSNLLSLLTHRSRPHFAFAVLSAVLFSAAYIQHAYADIYSYTDANGVTHFTNVPQIDKRYKLVYKDTLSAPQPISKIKGVSGLGSNTYAPWKPSKDDLTKYSALIETHARAAGIEPALVHAVIRAESGYNANALSPKGARGLMQLMPDTAKRFGVTNIDDPKQNIQGGIKYLAELLRMFNNNLELALAGYNAGEGAVAKAGNKVPNFNETIAYVPKVIGFYRSFNLQANPPVVSNVANTKVNKATKPNGEAYVQYTLTPAAEVRGVQ